MICTNLVDLCKGYMILCEGKDEGGAGGSLDGSTEDGREVLAHAEPWRRIWFCSTTFVVPYT
jgi:hypothetical protein